MSQVQKLDINIFAGNPEELRKRFLNWTAKPAGKVRTTAAIHSAARCTLRPMRGGSDSAPPANSLSLPTASSGRKREPLDCIPVIAQALYKMTYLENWGSGIRKIADSCREAGLEEPTYSDGKGFVSVCFKRPSYRGDQTDTPQVPP